MIASTRLENYSRQALATGHICSFVASQRQKPDQRMARELGVSIRKILGVLDRLLGEYLCLIFAKTLPEAPARV